MIQVTERAKKELSKVLTDNADNPEACLRLRITDAGNLGLAVDVEKPDDEVVEYEGNKLLVVSSELADNLVNLAIDTEYHDEGSRLVIVDIPR